jgi:hypothetical protein
VRGGHRIRCPTNHRAIAHRSGSENGRPRHISCLFFPAGLLPEQDASRFCPARW